MDNLFLKYMRERAGQRKSPGDDKGIAGPVITISREYGCHGQYIAKSLADRLTKQSERIGGNKQWRMISKEILERSAKELQLTSEVLEDLSDNKQKSFFEDLALFFSHDYYPGDAKVKNTIAKFLHEEAVMGYVVIVGRAGEAITKDIEQSFHVKMQAPLDWRAERIVEKEGLTFSDSKKKCVDQDKRRAKFRDYFERGKPDIEFFDMCINAKSMRDDEIVELLVSVADSRGFL